MNIIQLKKTIQALSRERVLLLCLIAAYVFVGSGIPEVNTVEKKLMSPLFTVQATVTAQFDSMFAESKENVSVEEVVEEHTGPDFTQRFAKALLEQQDILKKTCESPVIGGSSALEQALERLATFCLVDDAEKYILDESYGNIMVSKGEFLQYLVQLEALHSGEEVDEYGFQEGDMPYDDVKQDRWYTPYVYSAVEQGFLESVGEGGIFSKNLQPLGPVSRDEFRTILENAGHELPDALPTRLGGTEYVTKATMLRFLNVFYDDKLNHADTMYGNNMTFYKWIIMRTMKKTPADQEVFVQAFIDGFAALPAWKIDKKYGVNTAAMLSFLESFLAAE